MSETLAIYTIWLRELKRYTRERSRLVTSFVTPMLWLVIFGIGIGRVNLGLRIPGGNYQAFIFPGIIGQTLLFTAIWSGISVIWDREFGFLKEILVAPISRTSIVLGKATGGATSAFLQGLLLLPFSFMVGITLTPFSLLASLPVMFLIALGLVTIGLALAARIQSLEGFNMIMSFVIMPMFFLSGAVFPLGDDLPGWLRVLTYLDPLTYGVDALRYILLGASTFSIYIDILVLLGFTALIILIAAREFSIKK